VEQRPRGLGRASGPGLDGLFEAGCQRVGQTLLAGIEQRARMFNRPSEYFLAQHHCNQGPAGEPLKRSAGMAGRQLMPQLKRCLAEFLRQTQVARAPRQPGLIGFCHRDIFGHVRERGNLQVACRIVPSFFHLRALPIRNGQVSETTRLQAHIPRLLGQMQRRLKRLHRGLWLAVPQQRKANSELCSGCAGLIAYLLVSYVWPGQGSQG